MNNYSVYILRCWKDGNRIRFRLEDPHTNDVYLFASRQELDQFLSHLFDEETLTQNQNNEGDSNAKV